MYKISIIISYILILIIFNYFRIEVLSLEENKLGDNAALTILNSLAQNKHLRKLNLSKNYLSDKVLENISNIINDTMLEELYLHWN